MTCQLYEAILYLAIAAVLFFVYFNFNKQTGFIFGLLLFLLFSTRFFIEFLKEDQSAFEAGMILNMGQVLSIPFILIGIILIYLKWKPINDISLS